LQEKYAFPIFDKLNDSKVLKMDFNSAIDKLIDKGYFNKGDESNLK
jgi:hypothetical protein